MTCNGQTHNLVVIYSVATNDAPDSEVVVRWCSDCGAVVADLDVDNRTVPGRVVSMKLPRMMYPNKR